MSVTQNFQTNALYPGGEGKCGIGTHDPYPDGIPDGNIFKITKDIEDVWPLIWNLEDWSVSLDGLIDATESGSGGTFPSAPLKIDTDVSGQFHQFYGGIKYIGFSDSFVTDIIPFVYDGEPKDRVCGNGRFASKSPLGTTQGDSSGSYILPEVRMYPNSGDDDEEAYTGTPSSSASDSVDIEDAVGDVVGDCSVTRTDFRAGIYAIDGDWYIRVIPLYVRLQGSTVDIYFTVEALVAAAGSGATTSDAGASLANNNTTPPTYSGVASTLDFTGASTEAVTFTLLGETVDGYLWHRGKDSDGTTTFNSFSLSYDVTVTTAYTY